MMTIEERLDEIERRVDALEGGERRWKSAKAADHISVYFADEKLSQIVYAAALKAMDDYNAAARTTVDR